MMMHCVNFVVQMVSCVVQIILRMLSTFQIVLLRHCVVQIIQMKIFVVSVISVTQYVICIGYSDDVLCCLVKFHDACYLHNFDDAMLLDNFDYAFCYLCNPIRFNQNTYTTINIQLDDVVAQILEKLFSHPCCLLTVSTIHNKWKQYTGINDFII